MQLINPHIKKSEVTVAKAKRLPDELLVSDMDFKNGFSSKENQRAL